MTITIRGERETDVDAIRVLNSQEQGAQGCVVVGDPNYYRRFGFTPAANLVMPDVPAENLLVLTLAGRSPSGTVAFHPAFAVGNPPDSTS